MSRQAKIDRITDYLKANPTIGGREVANRLMVPPSSVTDVRRRLVAAGVLQPVARKPARSRYAQ